MKLKNRFHKVYKKIYKAYKKIYDLSSPTLIWVFAILVVLLLTQLFYVSFTVKPKWVLQETDLGSRLVQNPEYIKIKLEKDTQGLRELVLPKKGISIPVEWGDLGKKLVDVGVIDKELFLTLYQDGKELGEYEMNLLEGGQNEEILINSENSGVVLNLLWALGLANKNKILEEGPMIDEEYGGDAGNFASTGGWTLGVEDAMSYYSAYEFIILTPQQQELVEEVSKNIYRPCCGNSVYFPDCNHGMAMLGLIELMAAQGMNEQEIYDIALAVNSFWFPDTYITIAKYFAQRGIAWDDVSSKEVLGSAYSSAQGYAQIASEVEPVQSGGGSSCGV